jgi:ATP-dependent RNA helicase RhlE
VVRSATFEGREAARSAIVTRCVSTLRFTDLKLIDSLLQSLNQEGYEIPTPIQAQAIPHILAERDILGCAQTGTGKTAAFALPILQLLNGIPSRSQSKSQRRAIRCLVLTPTRELAAQIAESFDRYGSNLGLTNTVIFGGVGQGPQTSALRRGIDILVATPGRLLDLMEQRYVELSDIEIFVLDEADRMLDMGFIHDVRRVIRVLPRERHSLFFSATMPPDIQRLAGEILRNPVKIEVTPVATTAEKIEQSIYFVDQSSKQNLLENLMRDPSIARALVFTRTKHGADRVAKFLNRSGVPAEAIHGNKSQNNRTRALNNFKQGLTRALVATDIAARGIDIDGVTHVINYEIPNIPESYVHRIGRTARAGAEGIAISFCDREERSFLRDIERLIRMQLKVETLPVLTPSPRTAVDATPARPESSDRPRRPQSSRPPSSRSQGSRDQSRSSQSRSPRSNDGRSQGGRRDGGRNFSDNRSSADNRSTQSRSSGSSARTDRSPSPNRSSRSSAEGSRSNSGGGGRNTHSRGDRRGGSSRSGSSANATTVKRTESAPSSSTPAKKSWWSKLVSKK